MTERTGVHITDDKIISIVYFDGDGDLDLMQALVEGLIEAINLDTGDTMWVNEEFTYKFDVPRFNSVASDLLGALGRPDLMLSGIQGNVFITGGPDGNGNTGAISAKVGLAIASIGHEAGATFDNEREEVVTKTT